MVVSKRLRRSVMFLASLAIAVGIISSRAAAQYTVTNLVSNQQGKANHQDTDLINPWGVSYAPGGYFWVSDEGTGKSTLYNAQGVKQSLVVTIPPAPGGFTVGSPTGQVYNATGQFVVTENGRSGSASFIFATLDGTISGWSGSVDGTNAVIAVKSPGSVYTGLALATNNGSPFLYAADSANNKIDMFDGSFHLVNSFTDPNLPSGWNPYNVHSLQGKLVVTFVQEGTEDGVVDVFDNSGKFLKTLITNSRLHSPWGIALAPSNFGPASGALLIGNEDDGKVNAFNPRTGKFLGASRVAFPGLWEIIFGGGSANNGKTNELFLASGPDEYSNGLFSAIDVTALDMQ